MTKKICMAIIGMFNQSQHQVKYYRWKCFLNRSWVSLNYYVALDDGKN